MDNNINYIAFDFVEGNNNEISPENVEVEITALDQYKIAEYTANASGVLPTFNKGYQYTVNETESNGIYTVELFSYDDFTSCSFYGKSNLLTVEYLKVTNNVTTMKSMFYDCGSLTSLEDTSNWDTSNVTDMDGMFEECVSLATVNVSNWDTRNVTTMKWIFYDCGSLTSLDASNWDTSKVEYMSNMFQGCSKLTQLDISNWSTSNVTTMEYMFRGCSKLTQLDLSNWNTSNVTTMEYMFYGCRALTTLDISNWDTSNVTTRTNMFGSCSSLNDVIATNVSTSTLSTLVTTLPTRTSDSYGTINANNTTNEIISSANAKYWNVVIESVEPEDGMNNIKLGSDTIKNMYIGDSRIIQMYLNGQPLM